MAPVPSQVVDEEVLHYFPLVPECDYEFIVAIIGIAPHDMPDYRLSTDFCHWLRLATVSSESRVPSPLAKIPTFIPNFPFKKLTLGLNLSSADPLVRMITCSSHQRKSM